MRACVRWLRGGITAHFHMVHSATSSFWFGGNGNHQPYFRSLHRSPRLTPTAFVSVLYHATARGGEWTLLDSNQGKAYGVEGGGRTWYHRRSTHLALVCLRRLTTVPGSLRPIDRHLSYSGESNRVSRSHRIFCSCGCSFGRFLSVGPLQIQVPST